MDRLKDKVAIVTGAARGMGRATAELFVAEGASVVGGDVLDAEGTADSQVDFVKLDVTSQDSWRKVVGDTIAKYGKVDVLVNNAAIIDYSPILETTMEIWDSIIGVDQLGVFLGMQAVLPDMLTRKHGSIINVSSIWGLAGNASAAAYHAAKGAVVNMSRNVAVTHGPDGIRVNSVHPGYILTPMNANQAEDINTSLREGTVLKRPGQPTEVAYASLFLASDEASYVTGTQLVVDGGFLTQ